MIDFDKELNNEQREVILQGSGPCLVLAGAGSGKTRTITYRVAYLLEKGTKPENILLVTFTNKAAQEMNERVKKLTGNSERLPWAGTFHSIACRILKIYASKLGYQNNFSILDSDDSESIIKLCSKDYKAEGKKFPSSKILQAIISYARNAETTIADALEARFDQWMFLSDVIADIAKGYAQRKKEANTMDFDDLLVNFLLLLDKPEILEKFAEQFEYILVDEYQDTNKIQASIIKKLSRKHNNVLVVGDDAQSIYSFRAADISNILNFEKEYKGAKVFKLETNYRSSEDIVKVANDVIANNTRQFKKNLKSMAGGGAKPSLVPHMDQQGEAEFVANKIFQLINSGVSEHEIAVLFRAAHHSQMVEMELVKSGIRYDYRGGLRFFERKHIKDVLAYLRILNNLSDVAAWMRVLTHEEGIGPVAAGKLIDAIKDLENVEEVKEIGYSNLTDKAKNGWHNFARIWELMLEQQKNPLALIDAILNSPYREYLESEYIDSKDRIDDIHQLKFFAKKFDELGKFLADAALQESFSKLNEDEKKGQIVLSTVHQAKGLEWKAVFVINLASGAFPIERALKEDGGLEEERRLFYVAVTRAKNHLFLTYPMANNRPAWGEAMSGPSIFLSEISSDLIDDHSLLNSNGLVFNDPDEVSYESEDKPFNIKPGSFLRSVEDL